MSYHVEKISFKELPDKIIVHEDGYMDAYKNDGEPIVDYVYRREKTCRMRFMWHDYEDGEGWECSNCKGTTYTHGWEPSYCEKCGAKVVKR